MDLQSGTQIDRYEVLGIIGEGAMAHVYKVRHNTLNAVYALKLLKAGRSAIQARLLLEGQVQAALRHRNVVAVTDTVLIDGHVGLVLEYIDGTDLEEHLREHSPLTIEAVVAIGRGIIRGVRAAHREGHLHRDLKPANIMITSEDGEWVPKVADFGLAKALDAEPSGFSGTRTGNLMGSPAYMSPEQARDSKNVDVRTDVFALGCVLYELATGQQAFLAPDMLTTLARIAAGAFRDPRELRPELPASVVNAIQAALIVDRDQRVADCDALLDLWDGRQTFVIPVQDPKNTLAALVSMDAPRATQSPTVSTIAPDVELLRPTSSATQEPASPAVNRTFLATGAAVLMLLCLVLLFIAGAAGVWWYRSGMLTETPAAQVRDVETQPVPVIVASDPEPAQPTQRAQPTERPRPAERPKPVAKPLPPEPTASAPRPAPAPVSQPVAPSQPTPTVGSVRFGTVVATDDSDVLEVWLVGGGKQYRAGKPVPEGTYRIHIRTVEGGPLVDVAETLAVVAGVTKRVRCIARRTRCVVL